MDNGEKRKGQRAREAAGTLHGELLQGLPIVQTTLRGCLDAVIIVSGTTLLVARLLPPLAAKGAGSTILPITCHISTLPVAAYLLFASGLFFGSLLSTSVSTWHCGHSRFLHSALVTILTLALITVLGSQYGFCATVLASLCGIGFVALFAGYRAYFFVRRLLPHLTIRSDR